MDSYFELKIRGIKDHVSKSTGREGGGIKHGKLAHNASVIVDIRVIIIFAKNKCPDQNMVQVFHIIKVLHVNMVSFQDEDRGVID